MSAPPGRSGPARPIDSVTISKRVDTAFGAVRRGDMSFSKRFILRTVLIPSASILGLASATVLAQEAAPQQAQNTAPVTSEVEEVVVTGIRQSLESATEAKRASVAFGDSIYAEDIGKLPATNLAETLNRIPGVKLNRDINGEGVQISV